MLQNEVDFKDKVNNKINVMCKIQIVHSDKLQQYACLSAYEMKFGLTFCWLHWKGLLKGLLKNSLFKFIWYAY